MVFPQVFSCRRLFQTIIHITVRRCHIHLVRKHKINDGDFPREFVVKEALQRISEETRFVVTRSP